MEKIGRNDPCPCGSGKKYKKCCGRPESAATPVDDGAQSLKVAAVQCQRSGEIDTAIDLYTRYIEQVPDDAEVLASIGGLIYPRSQPGSRECKVAVDYLQRSTEIAPDRMDFRKSLCAALSHNFDMEALVPLCDQAARDFPAEPHFTSQKGIALYYLNQYDEARATLEAGLKKFGNNRNMQLWLAKVEVKSGSGDKAAEILEAIVASSSTNLYVDSSAWYELGLIEQDRDNFERAFTAFETAGELVLQRAELQSWKPEHTLKTLGQYHAWYGSGGWHSWRADVGDALGGALEKQGHRNLVFFIGFPRSGTTLTEKILGSHPQIETSEEVAYFTDSLERNIVKGDAQIDWLTALEQLTPETIAFLRDDYWRDVEQYHEVEGRLFLDKLPLNLVFLPWIQKVFPDAKFIVALRDPRDVCLSCFSQDFVPNSAMNHFFDWDTTTHYYREVMELWRAATEFSELPQYSFRYEDVVADVEGEIGKILAFMGLEWEAAMHGYRDSLQDRAVATPSFDAIRKPVTSTAVGKWQLYPEAMERASRNLRELTVALGYNWSQ